MDKNQNGRPNIPPRRGVFDIVRPGRTPASPNSRPVLNNQRPPVHDTSITVGPPAVPHGLMNSRQKVSVTSPPTPTPVPSPPAKPALQPQPTVNRPMHQPPVHSRPFTHQPQQQPMQAPQDVGETAVVGEVTRPEGVPESHLQEHPQHQRHSILSEVLAIVAIVFLIAVIVNILVDADVLDLPIPHTNFFEY